MHESTPEIPARTTTRIQPSLLRAPLFPDPKADQGKHRLSFGLLIGAEVLDAVTAGYRRNLPRREIRGAQQVEPLISLSNPAALVETIKLAEDGSGDVIVRIYESQGRRAKAKLVADFAVGAVQEADLLERPLALADLTNLELHPFQVRTLRLVQRKT